MSISIRQSNEISVALDLQLVIDRRMQMVTRMIVHRNEEIGSMPHARSEEKKHSDLRGRE